MKKVLTLLAIALAALTSCEEDSISISPTELLFDSEGGEAIVTVTSTSSWELYGYSEWCYGVSSPGEVTFIVEPNISSEFSRSTTFTFICGNKEATLTVTQEKKEYSISIEPTELAFEAEGGEAEVTITSSDEWSINSMPDWVEVSEKSGENGATIIVKVEYITEADTRFGEIVFTCGNKEVKVLVTQKADESPIIQFKDPKFLERVLRYFNADRNGDGQISEKEASVCTGLGVSDAGIRNLEEIKYFTALTSLSCNNNQLTSLDLSNNTALASLECNDNQLTSLDLSNNSNDNQLTSLDLSNNTVLTELSCDYNQLTSLDLSNNTVLTELSCDYNQLTSLDVSKNTALTGLYCSDNQLTSLDVSNNTALTYLYCSDNQLTSLDVSNNTALTYLYCYNNQLTSLDLSRNRGLEDFKPIYYYVLHYESGEYSLKYSLDTACPLESLIIYKYHILSDYSLRALEDVYPDLKITYVE